MTTRPALPEHRVLAWLRPSAHPRALLCGLALLLVGPAATPARAATTLVSHAAGLPGTGGLAGSMLGGASRDGRFLLFASQALDLIPGFTDANGTGNDVFLYDATTGGITLISHAAGALTTGGNGDSTPVAIDANGRFVLYSSQATNLVPGFTGPAVANAYLHDTATGTTTLVSHAAGAPATGGNDHSFPVGVSADGRLVLLYGTATNLVSGFVDGNGPSGNDVFLHDRVSQTTTLLSHTTALATTGGDRDSLAMGFSGDGRAALVLSRATDLVAGFTKGNGTGRDVFLYDTTSGSATLVSRTASDALTGGNGDSRIPARLSGDGRRVLFSSRATDLVAGFVNANGTGRDVFLYDVPVATMTLVSHAAALSTTGGDGDSIGVGLSADGRVALVLSSSTNLVPGLTDGNGAGFDVFVYDAATGATTLVSRAACLPAASGNQPSFLSGLSADGRMVMFGSLATDLLPGFVDGNGMTPPDVFGRGAYDVFLHDRTKRTTTLVSHAAGAPLTGGNGDTLDALVSGDGRTAAFTSAASNLVAGFQGPAGAFQIYRWAPDLPSRSATPARLVRRSCAAPGLLGPR